MSSGAEKEKAEDKLKKDLTAAAKVLEQVAKPFVAFLTMALPRIISFVRNAYMQFLKLPQNAIQFIYGTIFCFFGGTFPTLFAALQAAEYGGRKAFFQAVGDITDEILVVLEESKKDDEADEDKDGVADVNQISSQDYVSRKAKLVLRKMNPQKLDQALSSIYKVWIAVVAVLKVKFARTISLAMAMAEFLNKPIDRFITPTVQLVIPDEYDKWVPVVMSWITKSIAVSFAFYIQSIQSATASSLKGGLMMAEAAFNFAVHRGWTMFGLIPDDPKQSYLDEILSYIFAALGFYVQFQNNFSVPFPLNLVLWPFSFLEYWIRMDIVSESKK